ncbi:MAG: Hpt domain-containing protein [Woeseiaceae bacterium]
MSNVITSELLKDDPDLIELIDRFLSRLPAMQEKIVNACDEKEWDMFVGLIHQMKGVGGNYGYPMLTTLCADIEVAVKAEDYDKVNNQLSEFKELAKSILDGSEENHRIADK